MNENESAVRVATTIHGYFNYLEEKIEEGEYSYNEIPPGEFYFSVPVTVQWDTQLTALLSIWYLVIISELLETLKQSDLYSVGFSECFRSLSRHLAKAEVSYGEIIDMSSIGYRRSDLTTESSMKLYTSFFDHSSEISLVRHVRISSLLFIRQTYLTYVYPFCSWKRLTQLERGFLLIQPNPWGEAHGPAKKCPIRNFVALMKKVSFERLHLKEST